MDDGDPKNNRQIKKEERKTSSIQRYISNVSNVLSPVWIRRSIQANNGFEWIILGSRYSFLFNFRLFLVFLYLAYEVFK
jgi:hypothetical protein